MRKKTVATGALLAFLFMGSATASATILLNDDTTSPEHAITPNGLTYGKIPSAGADGLLPLDHLPDLVAVIGDGGKSGYVLADELLNDGVASPDEALAANQSNRERPRVLQVFDKDGVTVIDRFTLDPGNGLPR